MKEQPKDNQWGDRFEENLIKWLSVDPLDPQYMLPDMKAIKHFISSELTTLAQAFLDAVPKELGHGESWPHEKDLDFLNYTPCGIYNKGIEATRSALKKIALDYQLEIE
jgi:hypothetical protein